MTQEIEIVVTHEAQAREQTRLRQLPEDDRVMFNGKYWYARGPFDTEVVGVAQPDRESALRVFDNLLENRERNLGEWS